MTVAHATPNKSAPEPASIRMLPGEAMLLEAVGKFADVTLSVRTMDGWRTRRSQFLGQDGEKQALILAPFLCRSELPPIELAAGQAVGVTFRQGHKKCMFGSSFVRQANFFDGDRTWPQAMWFHWPEQLQHFQRRVYFRVPVPASRKIAVTIEPNGKPDGEAFESAIGGTLEDVSAGGIRIRTATPRPWKDGDGARISFSPTRSSGPLVLDGTFRYGEAAESDSASIGFQFVGLEATAQGRQMLVRLARAVTDLDRQNRNDTLPRRPRD